MTSFAADGPDVSGLAQPGFDWGAAAGCTSRQFASCRIAHGPYTSDGVVHPGFIDSNGAPNRDGMLAAGFGRRCWYVIVTPLEDAATAAARVVTWVGLNGGLPPGECVAIDWEDNPKNPGEAATVDQVLALWSALQTVYGPDRVGFYGSRGYLDQLPDARGFRWLASYTDDARDAAVARGCAVVQWTSSFECAGWGGRLDMNEVVDQGALDRACGVSGVVMGAPVGSFDLVEPQAGGVRVAGWIYDPDDPSISILAHVYIDGQLAGTTPADRERSDVNTTLGVPGNHGFDAVIGVPRATVKVDVYGIDLGGDPNLNALIGEKSVTIDLTVTAPPVDPPIVDMPPPVDPQPPVESVDEARVRAIAREEIGMSRLTPGGP